ncbi:MAG TPA: holo-ACP synthase [Microbacteriaceae bacterium]|nr:holo-ACP synthase [Microbacteriaceae bacterium]
MILGIGVDVVHLERFRTRLEATPALRERLFVPSERETSPESLAARFAAKEAVIKAMGGPVGTWHDVWIESAAHGAPALRFGGAVAEHLAARGVESAHVSLSHDGPVATAFVILEGASS